MVTAMIPNIKKSLESLTPQLLESRSKKLFTDVFGMQYLPDLYTEWNKICAFERTIHGIINESHAQRDDGTGSGIHEQSSLLTPFHTSLGIIFDIKRQLAECIDKLGGTIPSEKQAPAIDVPSRVAQSPDSTAPAPPPPELGTWAKEHVVHAVDFATRSITFRGNKQGQPGVTLTCPPQADGPWRILERMLTSTDPKGWTELTELEAPRYRQQFLRSDRDKNGNPTPGNLMLRELYAHIRSSKGAGKRGKQKIRLEHRAKEIKPSGKI